MTTATETTFKTISIEEAALANEAAERQYARLRTELGISAFGVSAVRSAAAGTEIVPEHDETGPGSDRHEELYVVLAGHAVFTVAGEEVDAPQGTAVFVGDPETRRGAVTKEDGTIILAVGGRAGEAFRVTPGELMRGFMEPYNAKDYAGALEIARGRSGHVPGQRARPLQHRVHGGSPRPPRRCARRTSVRRSRPLPACGRTRRRTTTSSPCGGTSASRS